jgi:hypothetical protein
MSAERVMMLVCGLCIGAAAVAEDAEDAEDGEAVDAAFLEYLGEWETEDDWFLFEDIELTAASEQDEPEEKDAASPEKEDES